MDGALAFSIPSEIWQLVRAATWKQKEMLNHRLTVNISVDLKIEIKVDEGRCSIKKMKIPQFGDDWVLTRFY